MLRLQVLASGVLVGPLVFHTVLLTDFQPVRGDSETKEAVEIRDFRISVDGDSCGNSRMSIKLRPDGRHVVVGDSSLELKYFLYTFRFSSQGNEIWNGGKLEKLESAASYGLSKYKVSAPREVADSVVVRSDGKERKLPRHVWTTSYWHAPEEDLLGQTVPLLDFDKGRSLTAKLERVGEEPISLGEKDRTLHPLPAARRRGSRSLVRLRRPVGAARRGRVGTSHPAGTDRHQIVAALAMAQQPIGNFLPAHRPWGASPRRHQQLRLILADRLAFLLR